MSGRALSANSPKPDAKASSTPPMVLSGPGRPSVMVHAPMCRRTPPQGEHWSNHAPEYETLMTHRAFTAVHASMLARGMPSEGASNLFTARCTGLLEAYETVENEAGFWDQNQWADAALQMDRAFRRTADLSDMRLEEVLWCVSSVDEKRKELILAQPLRPPQVTLTCPNSSRP